MTSSMKFSRFLAFFRTFLSNRVYVAPAVFSPNLYTVSQKTVPIFTAYNFRNIEQIFTKFGINQSLFILNIVPEFIWINFGK